MVSARRPCCWSSGSEGRKLGGSAEGQVQRRSGLCSWIGPVAESPAGWRRHRASERILAGRGGRRSGLTKRAPFDEAARGGGPGGPPLGGESNPVKPSAGIATESVRGNSVTFSPGRTRLGEGAPRGGIAIAIPQGRAELRSRGNLGRSRTDCRSSRLAVKRGSTRSCSCQGFDRAGGVEAVTPAKAEGCGDSRAGRSVECSCRESVADAG